MVVVHLLGCTPEYISVFIYVKCNWFRNEFFISEDGKVLLFLRQVASVVWTCYTLGLMTSASEVPSGPVAFVACGSDPLVVDVLHRSETL